MSHPYAVQPAKPSAGGIQNGSLVVLVFPSAENIKKQAPETNSFVESGVMNVWTSGRFDEHYGGGAS